MNPHILPPLKKDILCKITDDRQEFIKLVVVGYKEEAAEGWLVPRFSDDLFQDAHQAYAWDIQRLDKNMDTSPDHFKRCGHLAYWLRRSSPVLWWDKMPGMDDCNLNKDAMICRQFISDYGRAFQAFALGYRVCWDIERHRETAPSMPPSLSGERLTQICYFMKYKSVSPHAMGLIYEALFSG